MKVFLVIYFLLYFTWAKAYFQISATVSPPSIQKVLILHFN